MGQEMLAFMNWTAEERGYLAGIIDGEGTISYRSIPPRWAAAQVAVTSTSLELLIWLQAKAGGAIGKPFRGAPHHKTARTWFLTGRRAARFCEAIASTLVVKQRQAMLLVEAYSTGAASKWMPAHPSEIARRERISAEFRRLNRRGVQILAIEVQR